MNFLGDLPAEAREVLANADKQWTPESVADFAARWEKDVPDLVQNAREIDALLNRLQTESTVRYSNSEAYLRDITIQVPPPPLMCRSGGSVIIPAPSADFDLQLFLWM